LEPGGEYPTTKRPDLPGDGIRIEKGNNYRKGEIRSKLGGGGCGTQTHLSEKECTRSRGRQRGNYKWRFCLEDRLATLADGDEKHICFFRVRKKESIAENWDILNRKTSAWE